MSFLQSVRQKVEQVSKDVRERSEVKAAEKKKLGDLEKQERLKQRERFIKERARIQTDQALQGLKKKDDSRQRGFEMLGFGALRGQPTFNPITGGFGRVEQAQRPQKLSKKQRKKARKKFRQFQQPQRFDVVGGGMGGNRDIVGFGLRGSSI